MRARSDVVELASRQGKTDAPPSSPPPATREAPSLWSLLFFSWITPLIAKGYAKELQEDDLPGLHDAHRVEALHRRAAALLGVEQRRDEVEGRRRGGGFGTPLWRALHATARARMAVAGACLVAGDLLGYAGPLILRAILRFVEDEESAPFFGTSFGYAAAAALFAAASLQALLLHQHHIIVTREGVHARCAATAAVFAKSLRMPSVSVALLTRGRITNMVATDTHRILELFLYYFYAYTAPLQIAAIMALLYLVVGRAVAAALAVVAVALPLQQLLVRAMGAASERASRATDRRVHAAAEVVEHIRTVKLYAWERVKARRCDALRAEEERAVRREALLRAANTVLLEAVPVVCALAAFAAVVRLGDRELTPDVVFTALAFFNLLRGPLQVLPRVVQIYVNAGVSLARVDAYLGADELPRLQPPPPQVRDGEVLVRHADFRRLPDDADAPPVIADLSLHVSPGELVVCVGATGSGKTSLLGAVLGEMFSSPHGSFRDEAAAEAAARDQEDGASMVLQSVSDLASRLSRGERGLLDHCAAFRGRVAYAAQEPWIVAGTVRDNVLLGRPLDEARYREVLRACALDADLAAMEAGDQTEIGGRGGLSGGQRQRIGLARAVYAADADLYVFDDPLSALDPRTAAHVYREAVLGLLRGRTRIVVTHQLGLTESADKVMLLASAPVREAGGDDISSEARHRRQESAAGAPAVGADLDDDELNGMVRGRRSLIEVAEEGTFADLMSAGPQFRAMYEAGGDGPLPGALPASGSTASALVVDSRVVVIPPDADVVELSALGTGSIRVSKSTPAGGVPPASTWALSDHVRARSNVAVPLPLQPRPPEVLLPPGRRRRRPPRSAGHARTASRTFDLSISSNWMQLSNGGGDGSSPSPRPPSSASTVPPSPRASRAASPASGLVLDADELVPQKAAPPEKEEPPLGRQKTAPVLRRRGSLFADENSRPASSTGAVARVYAAAAGAAPVAAVLALLVGAQASQIASEVWLARWSESDRYGTAFGLRVYASISCATLALLLLDHAGAAVAGVRAARALYAAVFGSLMGARVAFFDSTPAGRVNSRLSRDASVVDKELPFTSHDFLIKLVRVVALVALVSAVTRVFAAAMVPVFAVFFVTQRYYRRASRHLKRLDNASRSPVFAALGEALDGLPTVRAFGLAGRVTDAFYRKVDANTRCFWHLSVTNRWLGVRLDLLGAVVLLAAALLCVALRDSLNAALVGLAVTNSFYITVTVNRVVREGIETELQLSSVERLHEYSRVEQEAGHGDEAGAEDVLPGWPSAGAVRFSGVRMRYRQDLPPALRDVSFSIEAGQKVGVVGRTGSGKTSLIAALFRTVGLEAGTVEVDGVDLARVPLRALRSRISIIPQDPAVFDGTLRENLDPARRCTDRQLWDALERVSLRGALAEKGVALDSRVEGRLSRGQKQLVAMARALVRRSRVLVLDEATSSLDVSTEQSIQRMTRDTFADTTLIIIAHRLDTLSGCDKVLQLDAGRVVRFDDTAAVLSSFSGPA